MNSTGDEVLWQYGPDSPNLVVLEEVVKVEAYDRIKYGISEKYQWSAVLSLPDTDRNRERLEAEAELRRDRGSYLRIVLKEDSEAMEKEQFIERQG